MLGTITFLSQLHRGEADLSSATAEADKKSSKSNSNVVTPTVALLGRLDLNNVSLIGHSFGGATVLSAAIAVYQSSSTQIKIKTLIALDPATSWIPTPQRTDLDDFFASDKSDESDESDAGALAQYPVLAGMYTQLWKGIRMWERNTNDNKPIVTHMHTCMNSHTYTHARMNE